MSALSQGDSYSCPPLFSPFLTMAPCFSCGPKPSPGFALPWCSIPLPIENHSPAHGTALLSPLGCPHTANPNPFPGTDLRSLSLSAQHHHPRGVSDVVSVVVVQMICVALTLLCPPQSSCCDGLSDFEILPSQLISLSVRLLPRMWVPFLFHRSLSGMLVPS